MIRPLIVSLVLVSMAPSAVLAQSGGFRSKTDTDIRMGSGTTTRAQICTQVYDHALNLETRFADLRVRLDEKREEERVKLDEKRSERSARIEQREEETDQERSKGLEAIQAQAKTDAQKAAVVKFRADIQTAISARRVAFQTADETFRRAVQDAIAKRRTSIDAALVVFQTSVKAALEKAKQDCAAGVPLATVRTSVGSKLKIALEKLQQDRKAIDRVSDSVRVAVKAHQDAHAKAMAGFRAAMEKARKELKAAFPVPPSP